MILISHRGNTKGVNPKRENSPSYIKEALDLGFYVEIDILFSPYRKDLVLCHELGGPAYEIDYCFLAENKDKLLIHCKDFAALQYCRESYYNFFYQSIDDYAVSSKGWVIAHSKVMNKVTDIEFDHETNQSILMLPEKYGFGKDMVKNCRGVCSDMIEIYA
jgi:hypothetical protein